MTETTKTLALKMCGTRPFSMLLPAVAVLLLSGCATLPISGPTGSQIYKDSHATRPPLPFQIVEVTNLADLPGASPQPPLLAPAMTQPTDLIGPGDVLDIQIYEAGVTLFGGSHASVSASSVATAAGGAGDAVMQDAVGGAQAARLPMTRVDDNGRIRVPYAGNLRAAGHTTAELAMMIRNALRGMSQNPQVVVNIVQGISGSVIVGGEVDKPGRLVLNTVHETLSDAIALSGGYRGRVQDLIARITREGHGHEYRLADILSGPDRDMEVSPGDRITVISKPQSYSVMGASSRVDVVPFAAPQITLAEAVAAAGGANPNLGDAKAVFVFRFTPGPDGKPQPVVYHLNMMRAGAYFISQRFAMRDKDLLYIGNAASNQPSKLIQLVSQLFSPVIAVESGLVNTGAL